MGDKYDMGDMNQSCRGISFMSYVTGEVPLRLQAESLGLMPHSPVLQQKGVVNIGSQAVL